MKKFNVFVTRKIPEVGLDLLGKVCKLEIYPHNRSLTKKELLKLVHGRDGLITLLSDKIDSSVINGAGPQLKVISNYAAGFENIDVAEATKRKILVTNTPGILSKTTAELAWALLLAVARRIPQGDVFTRDGKFKGWDPLLFLGQDIYGKTLGIIGAGKIGTEFALLSKGYKMDVLYSSRHRNLTLEKELFAQKVTLDQLLRHSDVISLHVPLTKETFHLIGRKEFAKMKRSAIFINSSRGAVVEETALVEALKKNKIFGAGLDVYEKEPQLAPGLKNLSNVVLAPHTGSASQATREKMAILAAQNLRAGLRGERPQHLVNKGLIV